METMRNNLSEMGINANKMGKGAVQRMYSEMQAYKESGTLPAHLLTVDEDYTTALDVLIK